MAGEGTAAMLRARIGARLRRIAVRLTNDSDAGVEVRRRLEEIAGRYEAGTERPEDGDVIVLLQAWVQQLTADGGEEKTDGIEG